MQASDPELLNLGSLLECKCCPVHLKGVQKQLELVTMEAVEAWAGCRSVEKVSRFFQGGGSFEDEMMSKWEEREFCVCVCVWFTGFNTQLVLCIVPFSSLGLGSSVLWFFLVCFWCWCIFWLHCGSTAKDKSYDTELNPVLYSVRRFGWCRVHSLFSLLVTMIVSEQPNIWVRRTPSAFCFSIWLECLPVSIKAQNLTS